MYSTEEISEKVRMHILVCVCEYVRVMSEGRTGTMKATALGGPAWGAVVLVVVVVSP